MVGSKSINFGDIRMIFLQLYQFDQGTGLKVIFSTNTGDIDLLSGFLDFRVPMGILEFMKEKCLPIREGIVGDDANPISVVNFFQSFFRR
jgi:hypothetical protein